MKKTFVCAVRTNKAPSMRRGLSIINLEHSYGLNGSRIFDRTQLAPKCSCECSVTRNSVLRPPVRTIVLSLTCIEQWNCLPGSSVNPSLLGDPSTGISSVVSGEPEPPTRRIPSGVTALVCATRQCEVFCRVSQRPRKGICGLAFLFLRLLFVRSFFRAFASSAISFAGFFFNSEQLSPSQAMTLPRIASSVGENMRRVRLGSRHCFLGDHSSAPVKPSGEAPIMTKPVGGGGALQGATAGSRGRRLRRGIMAARAPRTSLVCRGLTLLHSGHHRVHPPTLTVHRSKTLKLALLHPQSFSLQSSMLKFMFHISKETHLSD